MSHPEISFRVAHVILFGLCNWVQRTPDICKCRSIPVIEVQRTETTPLNLKDLHHVNFLKVNHKTPLVAEDFELFYAFQHSFP